MRKMKRVGASLIAALAICAWSAPTAPSASFTSEGGVTHVEASQSTENWLYLGGGYVPTRCEKVTLTGLMPSKTVPYIDFAATYSGCSAIPPWGPPQRVEMNGCQYRIHASGKVDLICPPGKDVRAETEFTRCYSTLPPQTELSGVIFTSGSYLGKSDLLVDFDVTNIAYTRFGSCPENGLPATNGYWTGKMTMVARDAGSTAPVGITWSP